jgi:hypothetical protein
LLRRYCVAGFRMQQPNNEKQNSRINWFPFLCVRDAFCSVPFIFDLRTRHFISSLIFGLRITISLIILSLLTVSHWICGYQVFSFSCFWQVDILDKSHLIYNRQINNYEFQRWFSFYFFGFLFGLLWGQPFVTFRTVACTGGQPATKQADSRMYRRSTGHQAGGQSHVQAVNRRPSRRSVACTGDLPAEQEAFRNKS